MIKYGGKSGKVGTRRMIGIVLSRRNTEKLLDGEPIHFQSEDIGIKGIDVLISAAETEEEGMRELINEAEKAGVPLKSLKDVLADGPEAQ